MISSRGAYPPSAAWSAATFFCFCTGEARVPRQPEGAPSRDLIQHLRPPLAKPLVGLVRETHSANARCGSALVSGAGRHWVCRSTGHDPESVATRPCGQRQLRRGRQDTDGESAGECGSKCRRAVLELERKHQGDIDCTEKKTADDPEGRRFIACLADERTHLRLVHSTTAHARGCRAPASPFAGRG